MTILEKANELGKALAEGAEYKRMRAADEAQQNDADAQLVLMNYNRRREEITRKAQQENITKEEMQAIRQEMDAEFEKLRQSPVIMEFLNAMEDFNNLMQQVNYTVTSYVSPQQAEGCGSDCGSCGGCH